MPTTIDGLPYVLPDSVVIPTPAGSTSSGWGISYWLPFLKCPRRAWLERQTGRGFEAPEDGEGNRKTDRYGKPKLNQTTIGILFHKILEHYHAHSTCACIFTYADGPLNLEWQEALRYFEAYRAVTPADAFGTVEACEEGFAFGSQHIANGDLPGDSDRAIQLLGVPYFTGRRDMRTKLTDNAAQFWMAETGIPLQAGHDIIVDTKTKTREDQTLFGDMMESLQFHSYMMAACALGIDVKGVIANVIIGTKEIKLRRWFVPFPSERQQQIVRETLAQANWVREHLGEQHANVTHCSDYFKPCPFFLKECDRTTPESVERLLTIGRS